MSGLTRAQELIVKQCDRIKELLLGKNRKYGNSAMEPLNVFSKLDPIEGIKLRIDDKLKRIKNVGARVGDGEKTDDDLIGYLILLLVAEELADEPKQSETTVQIEGAYGSTTTATSAPKGNGISVKIV